MNDLKPFIYWFGFEDSAIPSSAEQSNIYFYQTIILAPSPEMALSWGDVLSKELVKSGYAVRILSSWLEDVVPCLVSLNDCKPIKWENISNIDIKKYYQCTASPVDKTQRNINVFVCSKNQREATTICSNYLMKNKLNYKIVTCGKPAVAITKVGMPVEWN